MNRLALLSAFAVLALIGGPVHALNEKNLDRPGQPRRMNVGEDDLIRVRERMREEYRTMREERRKAMKEAEELTTGRSSASVPGWRTGKDYNPAAGAQDASPEEMTPDELMPGQATLVNVFLIVCGVGLSLLLVFRLRRGAAMRKRKKRFRKPDGPMTVSLNSLGVRRHGGQQYGYSGRAGVGTDRRSSPETTPRAS